MNTPLLTLSGLAVMGLVLTGCSSPVEPSLSEEQASIEIAEEVLPEEVVAGEMIDAESDLVVSQMIDDPS